MKKIVSLKKIVLFTAFGMTAFMGGYGEDVKTPSPHMEKSSTKETEANNKEFSPEEMAKISEAFGHFIGRNLNSVGVKFDVDSVITGIRNGIAGKPAPMNDQDYECAVAKLQEYALKQMATTNLNAAEAFLAQNAKVEHVVELVPGRLQYLVLKEGSGAEVTEKFSPQIQYTGKYIDGTVFGSSEEAGGTITVPLDQTIQGFSKGLIGMKEGEKRRIFVHPELGYGTTGHLPPNSLLIFDVELVKANAVVPDVCDGDDLSSNDLLNEAEDYNTCENDDLEDGDALGELFIDNDLEN